MKRLLAALLLSVTASSYAEADFTFANAPGPYQVGLRVQQQYDYSRVYKPRLDPVTVEPSQGERARPIQALVWYPAQGTGKPLTYRDYVATQATEEEFHRDREDVRRATDALTAASKFGSHGPQVQKELSRPMWAVRDASEQAGKFPVVIYAPSYSASAMENADLCEYLASQGYIVLASPSLGPHTHEMTSDLEGLEAQAGDIEFLIGYAHSLHQADLSRLAVVGFSWGGLSNVLAAAKDDRIKALVSLDGSMRGYTEYVNGGKDAAKYASPERLAIPLLYVAKHNRSVEEINRSQIDTTFNLMNQMKYSDVYIVTMHPMNHMDFSSWALRLNRDEAFEEYSREEASLAHTWVARYVHHFLDAYLKNDPAGLAFMNNSAVQNKVPPHMLSLDVRHGQGAPPTMETYLATLAKGGFGHAVDAYEDIHAKNAKFSLSPPEINTWGYKLLAAGRDNDAVEIFKLGTHLYPEQSNPYDSLAEAYERVGNRDLAVSNYRRSLELDPKNAHAVQRLKALGDAGVSRETPAGH